MPEPVRVNAYSTRCVVDPPPSASGDVVARPLWSDDGIDPDVEEHLAQMRRSVAAQPAPARVHVALDDHVAYVWWLHTVQLDPTGFDALGRWARETNAALWVEGQGLLDPDGAPLLGDDARGTVPVMPRSLERSCAQRELMRRRGIVVPADLLPIRCEDEVRPRSAPDIARRALALALTAYFAHGVLTRPQDALNDDDMRRDCPRSFDAMAEPERELFRLRDPEHARRLQWCAIEAESLLWALGRLPLSLPSGPPSHDAWIDAAFAVDEGTFLSSAQLRPLSELLDEAEREHALAALRSPARDVSPLVAHRRDQALQWALDPRLRWAAAPVDEDAGLDARTSEVQEP